MFSENRIFNDKNTIDDIARINIGVAEKIYKWIKEKLYSFIPGTKEKAMLLKGERLYRNAIAEARKSTSDMISIALKDGTNIKYKLNSSFAQNVEDIYRGNIINECNAVLISKITPAILKSVGMEDKPIYMTVNHLRNAIGIGRGKHQHCASKETLKNCQYY